METPIRILHAIGKMDRGGAETMIMNLYRQIDRNKVQFDFMVHTNETGAYDEEILSLGGRIFRVPRFIGTNIINYTKCWKLFFKEHPEIRILHGHIGSSAAIYLKIAKSFGCITIAHSHSTDKSNLLYNAFSYPTRYIAEYLFACSIMAGISRYGKRQWNKKQGTVLKNGVDIDAFKFSDSIRNDLRKQFHCENDLVVGSVARFVKAKNHSLIIDIFYELKRSYKNAKLFLVGDGPLKGEIIDIVKKRELSEDVLFPGVVDNVNEYMCMFDVLLMPSLYEGLPVTIVEAQALGLPCLISDKVPIECKIIDFVQQIALNESADVWADAAISAAQRERKNTYEEIKKAGYDIQSNAEALQDFYIKLASGEDNVWLN